jgi:hypothetical protein
MKNDIINVQASVRAKLQNKAKESNRPFAEVLQPTRGIIDKLGHGCRYQAV